MIYLKANFYAHFIRGCYIFFKTKIQERRRKESGALSVISLSNIKYNCRTMQFHNLSCTSTVCGRACCFLHCIEIQPAACDQDMLQYSIYNTVYIPVIQYI